MCNCFLKRIFKIFPILAIVQKFCFAAEESPDQDQLSHIRNHVPFGALSVQNIPPAVQEINKQLRQDYSRLNPNIHLPEAAYAEISQISQQYESAPTDIFYNYHLNQVKLIWETGNFFSFLRTKKRTFDLSPVKTTHSNVSSDTQQSKTPTEWINSELFKCYGGINPNIALLTKSHEEITHITMRHESFPEEMLYNHQKNQVQLIWKKRLGCFSFGKTKRTCSLANKIIRNQSAVVPTQARPESIRRATIHTVNSQNIARSVNHPITPDYYLAQHSNVQHRYNITTAVVQQREPRAHYMLSEQAATSIFNEWYNGLDPSYPKVYLNTPDYNDLITNLRKHGRASLTGWIENSNSWALWATWPKFQRRYQLWGLK